VSEQQKSLLLPPVTSEPAGCVLKQNGCIATDVKVAPGGTENVDTEIYEAVVSQPIAEPQVGRTPPPRPVPCR